MKIEKWELERKNFELEQKIDSLENKNRDKLFEKAEKCWKYRQDLPKNYSFVELFYSTSENTCVLGSFYSRDMPNWIEMAFIEDVITWKWLWVYDCNTDSECLKKFSNKIEQLKK